MQIAFQLEVSSASKLGISLQLEDKSLPWKFTAKSTLNDICKQITKVHKNKENYGICLGNTWLPLDTPVSQFSKGVKFFPMGKI